MRPERIGRVAQRDHARIEKETAIAVFRQAGEIVDVDDLDPRPLQRLDQGIAQPLRELVEGHEPGRGLARRDQRMAPGVAERNPAQGQARGPDAAEGRQHLAENIGRPQRAGLGAFEKAVEEIARPGEALPLQLLAEPVHQRRASLDRQQRIAGPGLKAGGQGLRVEPLQRGSIGVQRRGRVAREQPGREHVERGERQPFGAADLPAGRDVAIAPVRPGPGIEQDADHREVIGRPAPFGRAGEAGLAVQRRPAILPADDEMPPARMEGNLQRRIVPADGVQDVVGAGLEPADIHREMQQAPGEAEFQHLVGAGPDGRRLQQRPDDLGIGGRHQNLSRSRPTVAFSALSPGAPSGE